MKKKKKKARHKGDTNTRTESDHESFSRHTHTHSDFAAVEIVEFMPLHVTAAYRRVHFAVAMKLDPRTSPQSSQSEVTLGNSSVPVRAEAIAVFHLFSLDSSAVDLSSECLCLLPL